MRRSKGCIYFACDTIILNRENDPYTFSINSSPFGIPFKDWVVKWSTWELSFPKQENWNFRGSPGYVYKDCSYRQNSSSPVFFLPYVGAELGQVASMSCDVPRNKALLINIAGATSDYNNSSPKTPSGLIKLETQSNVYPVAFGITLDGHPITFTNDQKYLVQTDLYNVTLPANNIWGEPPGDVKTSRLVAYAQTPYTGHSCITLYYGL